MLKRLLLIGVAGLLAGCGTITIPADLAEQIQAEIDRHDKPATTNAPPVVVQPAPVTNPPPVQPPKPPNPNAEPNPANPGAYRAGFLWKPEAEGGGPLVVLYPAAYTGHIAAFWLESDSKIIEMGTNGGVHNGDRFHARYSKRGGAYPNGTVAVLVTDSGCIWRWKIPKTSSRHDGTITPTVVVP